MPKISFCKNEKSPTIWLYWYEHHLHCTTFNAQGWNEVTEDGSKERSHLVWNETDGKVTFGQP
ncbi:MAG: hypothetical protein NZ937_07365 [Armatimonadetes bacterium]|nr:hypothetical protein [Armatimonadota bacterium]